MGLPEVASLIILGIICAWILREHRWRVREKTCWQKNSILMDELTSSYFEMNLNGELLFIDSHIPGFFKLETFEIINEKIESVFANKSENINNNKNITKRSFDLTYLNENGTTSYIKCSLYLIKDYRKNPLKFIGVCSDVTEQAELRLKMNEEEQKYRSLFDNNPKAVFSFDLNGDFTSVNPVCKEYTGYDINEFLGSSYKKITLDDDLDKTIKHFQNAANGIPQNYETRIICKNNSIMDVSVTNVPIVVNENIIGVYGIAENITERKRTDELLRRSDKLAVVGELAAGIAHEIRNPLTPIKGFLQLLQSGKGCKKEYIDVILQETSKIEAIVNDYLLFAKAESTAMGNEDIVQVLAEVVKLLTPEATKRNIQVNLAHSDTTILVYGNKSSLQQVFVNLLKNAIEAMPNAGEIIIRVVRLNPSQVTIQIIDHGCGIPKNILSKLGEPFYTTKEKGTGLGLMICYKIIANHHGKIQIESAENEGTTASVFLPVIGC